MNTGVSFQGIAESNLLEYFRLQGVFTAPEVDGNTQTQTLNFERLIKASVAFGIDKGGDKRMIHGVLTDCVTELIKRL